MQEKTSQAGSPAGVPQISELAYAARLAENAPPVYLLLNAQGHLRSVCHSAAL